MKNRRNYYRILHVQPDAPTAVIKVSYRTLMQKLRFHPDLGGDEWNACILNEAYATLIDEKKRAAYDQQFRKNCAHVHPGATNHQPDEPGDGAQNQATYRYRKDDLLCPFCNTPVPVRNVYNSGSSNCTKCNSPLQKVAGPGLVDDARRSLQRSAYQVPIAIYTQIAESPGIPGIIVNLSPQGMQFVTSGKLCNNQVIKVTCDVLLATARVAYIKKNKINGQHIIGAEFLTLQFRKSNGMFLSCKI